MTRDCSFLDELDLDGQVSFGDSELDNHAGDWGTQSSYATVEHHEVLPVHAPDRLAGTLIRRYKRFLADVDLEDGGRVTVHCPNTGAMLGCDRPGSRVWLSRSANPRRKYPLTWELVQAEPGVLVGINTGRTNALVAEALAGGRIPVFAGASGIRREVALEGHRVDFLLEYADGPGCYLEVKNVTAAVSVGVALFPDAVSLRASRHLALLASLVRAGHRAALVYCVQREDVRAVRAAGEIDPAYAEAVAAARAAGVGIHAWGCRVSPREIVVERPLEVLEDVL